MDVCLLCLYVVLSCVGRGLCDRLTTRPEESYRVSNVCDHRNPERGPMFQLGTTEKWMNAIFVQMTNYFTSELFQWSWVLCRRWHSYWWGHSCRKWRRWETRHLIPLFLPGLKVDAVGQLLTHRKKCNYMCEVSLATWHGYCHVTMQWCIVASP
jgi:hypothetical protein